MLLDTTAILTPIAKGSIWWSRANLKTTVVIQVKLIIHVGNVAVRHATNEVAFEVCVGFKDW